MDKLSFKLVVFEGPLDLLLHLISKNKVNIYDIPIKEITTQYFEVIEQMQKMDLDVSSEFIIMAAQLLYIKSKMLLPQDEEEQEEDPRDDLANRLLEYKKYKEVSGYLREHEFSSKYMFFKTPDDVKPKVLEYTGEFDIQALTEAFYDILERTKRRTPPPKKIFDGIVKRSVVSVKDKISDILSAISDGKKISFNIWFENLIYREEMVAAFLAVLELIKDGRLAARYIASQRDFELSEGDKSGYTKDYNGEDEYE